MGQSCAILSIAVGRIVGGSCVFVCGLSANGS
jgi:hypothetical protein